MWTLGGGILHTTLLSVRVVIKVGFVCFPMPVLHHYSPGITLSIPNCLTVLNLTAPCVWLVNSESFCMLPFCTNAISETQYSLNALAAVFSIYFPVQLHESLFCRRILVFVLFLFFLFFYFLCSSISEGRLNMSHRPASPGKSCASPTERRGSASYPWPT